jgi:Leucine-rich repeat (LRR) protein
VNNYTKFDSNKNIIKIIGNSLDFSLFNQSGFRQPYRYIFSDMSNSGGNMFQTKEGEIILDGDEKINLSFVVDNSNISSTEISFKIWPKFHEYNIRDYEFSLCGDCGCSIPCSQVCDEGYSYFSSLPIEINNLNNENNCFNNNDLNILRDLITINKLDYFSPLEIGTQMWNNGRLISLVINYTLVEEDDIDKKISFLSSSIGELSELRTLSLKNHNIYNLPESLPELNNLVSLTLSNNKLSTLPENIGNLNKLIYLDLGFNELESIPESIGKLNHLEYLYIFNNQLMNLPYSICDLTLDWSAISPTNSPYFACGGNKICDTESIPDCIENSENFNISLEQNDYTFLVNNNQDCNNLSINNNKFDTYPQIGAIFPNPFNPIASINYSISKLENISIVIVNVKGEEVVELFSGMQEPGFYTINWNALDVASGLYFIKIISKDYILTEKLMLIK